MPFDTGEGGLLQLDYAGFDFNVQFEQLFFSIVPSAIFIATPLWRTLVQARKPTVVDAPVFRLVRLGAIATYVGLELSLLILAAVGSFRVTGIFVAASVLELVSAFFMVILSLVDHSKSSRPSTLLNSYLFLTLLLDAAKARTLFLSPDDRPELTYSAVFCATVALKGHSPEETSGIFSLGVFFWLNKLFWDGYNKTLAIEDLYPLDSSLNAEMLHDEFSRHMHYSRLEVDKLCLVKALIRTLRAPLLLPVAPRLALLGFTSCQPFFIQSLVDHLSQPKVDSDVGYGLIGASLLIYSGIAISTALYWYFHHRMRTMVTSILVTETFVKATKLQIGAGDDSAALTLMSTDMERINMGLRSLHEMWASLIQVVVAAYLLYNQLGVAFVAPMILVAARSAGLAILIRFTGDSQRAWMAGVQKRVGLTATVIAGIKNLKMSALSPAIGEFVQRLRVDELKSGSRYRKISLYAAILGYLPVLLGPPVAFAFSRKELDAARAFASLSYLLLLTDPLSQIFQNIPMFISAMACLSRIQTFLACQGHDDFRKVLVDVSRYHEKAPVVDTTPSGRGPGAVDPVIIQNGSFGWQADRFALRDVNIRVAKASLTLVVGPIGSGKSTLCKALLGEIPFSDGGVCLGVRLAHVGYCDQAPFLSNGTIRDNNIGFSDFDSDRYFEIVEATALTYDFNTLERGDHSNVGSNGIILSGGQKQRVALARALYLQSDLLVLDDIFSGLDADTEEQVFRRVFGPQGLLRRRRSTVVLCTHSTRHLPAADHIIALDGGRVTGQGSFDELMAHQGYVRRLGLTRPPEESSPTDGSDTEIAAHRLEPNPFQASLVVASSDDPDSAGLRPVSDKTVYMHYLRTMDLFVASGSCVAGALYGGLTNFSTIWLTFWSHSASSEYSAHSFGFYASIYAVLQAGSMASLALVGALLFVVSVERAGADLHSKALRTLVRAPLSFFTRTDVGIVTNLFSQDLNLTDTELPNSLLNVFINGAELIGQACVMLTSSPYMAISYPFLLALMYLVQKFYLRTSKQMRILDLEAKSPLYTHFLDTLKGIASLRAFGFIQKDIRKNTRLINTSQRPAYLLIMVQQWLTFVLDIIVMLMAVILTTLAVRLHSNSGFTGASLVTLMNFGNSLSGIVIYYAKLETSIGAIARLKAFNENVKPEDTPAEVLVLPRNWPEHGTIQLHNVSASYDLSPASSHPPKLALSSLSLQIRAGERVAICGRTGSGKSTLISLLLKLLDPLPSTHPTPSLLIASVPLPLIPRQLLRERIFAVPQEAVFLPDGSSFRANLDPSGSATAQECDEVLGVVGLAGPVNARGGIEAGMNPGRLSAGERQLLSLGRVVVRRRVRDRERRERGEGRGWGVLLLDEVSSNVDRETERVMQRIIREEFEGYTVVAVSHRLEMVMDFDRVVVMEKGEIVEVGRPRELVGEVGSWFGELVAAAGRKGEGVGIGYGT